MMKNSLLAYKVGLAAIGIFVLGLVVYVATQASATKQDTQTYTKASSIAQKLDDYVNNQGTIPDSLQVAGITNVPSTIAYSKVSDQSFKFCVTYKANGNGLSGTSLSQSFATIEGSALGSGSPATYTLVISSSHKKGANCQTITPPYLSSDFGSSNSNDTYDLGTPTETQ